MRKYCDSSYDKDNGDEIVTVSGIVLWLHLGQAAESLQVIVRK